MCLQGIISAARACGRLAYVHDAPFVADYIGEGDERPRRQAGHKLLVDAIHASCESGTLDDIQVACQHKPLRDSCMHNKSRRKVQVGFAAEGKREVFVSTVPAPNLKGFAIVRSDINSLANKLLMDCRSVVEAAGGRS